MSNGPMVSAKVLLRVKRERDTLLWLLTLLLAAKLPARATSARPGGMFDYKMRQAGERDE